MKADKYVISGSLGIWRYKQREGPPVVYIVHLPHKHTTRSFTDKKEAIRFIGWPKSTPTGQAIREWFEQFDENEPAPTHADKFQQQIRVEGFGPEAHADDETDPTANTKMVL